MSQPHKHGRGTGTFESFSKETDRAEASWFDAVALLDGLARQMPTLWVAREVFHTFEQSPPLQPRSAETAGPGSGIKAIRPPRTRRKYSELRAWKQSKRLKGMTIYRVCLSGT